MVGSDAGTGGTKGLSDGCGNGVEVPMGGKLNWGVNGVAIAPPPALLGKAKAKEGLEIRR